MYCTSVNRTCILNLLYSMSLAGGKTTTIEKININSFINLVTSFHYDFLWSLVARVSGRSTRA